MELLKKDPYEIVDYALRPSITGTSGSKNQRAFYSIQYFRETIRPVTVLKPNEGRRTVVILTSIDTMRAETANAFLKLLEEPSGNVLFILTAESSDAVLPTIRSRCQQIRFEPLTMKDVMDALVERDGFSESDATYLARLTDGFYALAKFQDIDQLKESRDELIQFLRASYTQDAPVLLRLIQKWNNDLNLEGQVSLLNALELLLRDVLVARETGQTDMITHQDQSEVILKMATTLQDADLDAMMNQLSEFKISLLQNVQFKLIMPVISLRYFSLMRGKEPVLSTLDPWKHIPAFVES
jgi:DNA polymerase-3 subunit delta'